MRLMGMRSEWQSGWRRGVGPIAYLLLICLVDRVYLYWVLRELFRVEAAESMTPGMEPTWIADAWANAFVAYDQVFFWGSAVYVVALALGAGLVLNRAGSRTGQRESLESARLDSADRSHDGFTLVEMMVVVGLIALMTAIGHNQYQKQLARARQSEAKTTSAAMYAAHKTYFAQMGTYSKCISIFSISWPGIRYYRYGYMKNGLVSCGPNGNVSCDYYTFFTNGAGDKSCNNSAQYVNYTRDANGGSSGNIATQFSTHGAMTKTTFVHVAAGSIYKGTTSVDSWTINQDKEFKHVNNGIP